MPRYTTGSRGNTSAPKNAVQSRSSGSKGAVSKSSYANTVSDSFTTRPLRYTN